MAPRPRDSMFPQHTSLGLIDMSKLVCPATLGLAVFHVLQECLSPHFGCPPEHAKRCDGTPSFRCASVGRAAAAPAWAALRLPHHWPTQRLL